MIPYVNNFYKMCEVKECIITYSVFLFFIKNETNKTEKKHQIGHCLINRYYTNHICELQNITIKLPSLKFASEDSYEYLHILNLSFGSDIFNRIEVRYSGTVFCPCLIPVPYIQI